MTSSTSKSSCSNSFWNGFIMGAFLIFLFGTHKGRSYVYKALEIAENLESLISEFDLEYIDSGEFSDKNEKTEKSSNILDILSKIQKSFSAKEGKKYFEKK